jgi:hypothetical protein
MNMRILTQKSLILGGFCLFFFITVIQTKSRAEMEFFQTPEERQSPIKKQSPPSTRGTTIVKVLFFISPRCTTCPDEAVKLERELSGIGFQYKIEGIFVGNPTQVGKYLADRRTYPFNFELGLDMDGMLAKRYGVKTFPSAVIEVDGKRAIVTKASEIESKLR